MSSLVEKTKSSERKIPLIFSKKTKKKLKLVRLILNYFIVLKKNPTNSL